MRLDHDAGLALVGVAHVFARGNGFGNALIEIMGGPDARAVFAAPAEVGQPVAFRRLLAIHGLRQHQGQRVLPCSARPGQDHGLRNPPGTHAFTQTGDGRRIPQKFAEAHTSSLVGRMQARQTDVDASGGTPAWRPAG